jgi:hypothetical protein
MPRYVFKDDMCFGEENCPQIHNQRTAEAEVSLLSASS